MCPQAKRQVFCKHRTKDSHHLRRCCSRDGGRQQRPLEEVLLELWDRKGGLIRAVTSNMKSCDMAQKSPVDGKNTAQRTES